MKTAPISIFSGQRSWIAAQGIYERWLWNLRRREKMLGDNRPVSLTCTHLVLILEALVADVDIVFQREGELAMLEDLRRGAGRGSKRLVSMGAMD